jgi:hypothetical protein
VTQFDGIEGGEEAFGITADKGGAQRCFAGEMIVETCCGDAEADGDIGVAETVEAATLEETLGGVEDAAGRIGAGLLR